MLNSKVANEFFDQLAAKPAPNAPELHPINLVEVEGGAYDGDYALTGVCPNGCNGLVLHYLNPEDIGVDADKRHRGSNCAGRCEGGYTLPATVPTLVGGPFAIDSRERVRDFFAPVANLGFGRAAV